jgi:hypothetical protein
MCHSRGLRFRGRSSTRILPDLHFWLWEKDESFFQIAYGQQDDDFFPQLGEPIPHFQEKTTFQSELVKAQYWK